ncbi:hypothetical protein C2E23DRAFT_273282 [Lenzites betulinus]|nr:hypothetical protein C2E23DRAFT_273282 [Lenzites betulinus]
MPSTIIYTSTDAPRSSMGRDSYQAVRKSSVVNSPQDGLLSVLYHPPFLTSIHLSQPMPTDTYPTRVRVAARDSQDTKMLHARRRSLQPSLKPALKQDINAIHKLSSHPQTNGPEYSEYRTVLYSTRPSRSRTTLAWPPQPLHSTLSQSRAQHPREGVPGDITHTLNLRNERDPVIVRTRLANRSYFNASLSTSGRDTTPRTPRTSTPYASSVDVYLLPKSTSSTITTSSGLRDDDDEIVGCDGAERKCDVAPIGFPKPTSPCRVASPLCETAMNTISQRLEPEPRTTVARGASSLESTVANGTRLRSCTNGTPSRHSGTRGRRSSGSGTRWCV